MKQGGGILLYASCRVLGAGKHLGARRGFPRLLLEESELPGQRRGLKAM